MGAQTAPEHDLTPSEVALARVLAAWEAWPGRKGSDDADLIMTLLHEALYTKGLITPGSLATKGYLLIERARKAGVL